MSRWTHICAVIKVDIFRDLRNPKKYVESILKEAPKITGAEKNAEYFVNVLRGYNSTSYYGRKLKRKKQYQSRAVITIVGDLRHKTGRLTRKEYLSFINYIKEIGWYIDEHSCFINDEFSKQKKVINGCDEIVEEDK